MRDKNEIKQAIMNWLKMQEDEMRAMQATIAFCRTHLDGFAERGIEPHPCSDFVVFRGLSRYQVLWMIKKFPGVWAKSADDDKMEYRLAMPEGFDLRISTTELPPSCKLVEEIVDVPATRKTIKRIVCNEEPVTIPEPEVLAPEDLKDAPQAAVDMEKLAHSVCGIAPVNNGGTQ